MLGNDKNKMDSAKGFVRIIQPPRGWLNIDYREMWQFRDLFTTLIWRDIKVKYTQSLLGALWALIVPLVQMVIFVIIFGRLAKLPTDGIQYPVYYFSGLILWTYFANSVNMASLSLASERNFLTKIYFPRMFIPSSHCFGTLIDFSIASVLLAGLMIFYHTPVDASLLLVPLMVIVTLIASLGVSFAFSALNVKFRDIRFALPFIIQIWQYGSIIFPYNSIPESWGNWRYLYGLNPIGVAIEGFRWSLFHTGMTVRTVVDGVVRKGPPDFPFLLFGIGIASTLIIFLIGFSYFRKMEDAFADIV